jgi:hypothetical protein
MTKVLALHEGVIRPALAANLDSFRAPDRPPGSMHREPGNRRPSSPSRGQAATHTPHLAKQSSPGLLTHFFAVRPIFLRRCEKGNWRLCEGCLRASPPREGHSG